eukprot:Tbor_TRINITY_DN9076_c0_g1::TRINITY_DN9076_c0_g1_i1::g.17786::m.17786
MTDRARPTTTQEQEPQPSSSRICEGVQKVPHSHYGHLSYSEHNNALSLELPSEVMSDVQGLITDCKLGRIVAKEGWCAVRDFRPQRDSESYSSDKSGCTGGVRNNYDAIIMALSDDEKEQLREKLLGMPSFTQTFAFRVVGIFKTLLSSYMRAQRFGQCTNEYIDNHDFKSAAEDGEEDAGDVDNAVESDRNDSGFDDIGDSTNLQGDRCIATESFELLMDSQLISAPNDGKKITRSNSNCSDETDWIKLARSSTFRSTRIVDKEVSKISEAQVCYFVELIQTVGNKLCQMLPYSVQFLVDIVTMRVFSLVRGALGYAKITTEELRERELSKYLQKRHYGRRCSSFMADGGRSGNGSGALGSPTSPQGCQYGTPSRRGPISHLISAAAAGVVRSADRMDSSGVVLKRVASSLCDFSSFRDDSEEDSMKSNDEDSCERTTTDIAPKEESSRQATEDIKINNYKSSAEDWGRDTTSTEKRDINFRKVINRIRGDGSQYSFDFGVFTDTLADGLDGFAGDLEDLTEEFRARAEGHIFTRGQKIMTTTEMVPSSLRCPVGSSILTIGCSYTTLQFLIQAARIATFQLYVIEGHSSTNDGHHMLALAVKLFNPNIHVQVLTNSSVYAVMPTVTKVFIGCDYVLATGGILASIGTQPICMVAKHFSVPVVVLASSLKFMPWYPSNLPSCTSVIRLQEHTNREAICSKYRAITSVSPSVSKLLSAVNNTGGVHRHSPGFGVYPNLEDAILMVDTRANEYTPPHLITLIVTEEKDFTTSQVDLHIRLTYKPMDALNLIIGEAS